MIDAVKSLVDRIEADGGRYHMLLRSASPPNDDPRHIIRAALKP
jgi:hypothetical protein